MLRIIGGGMTIFLGGLTLIGHQATAAPSFDCAKAKSTAEIAVCHGSAYLQSLDVELSSSYQKTMRAIPKGLKGFLRESERQWLDQRSAACWSHYASKKNLLDQGCLENLYRERIAELNHNVFELSVGVKKLPWAIGPYPGLPKITFSIVKHKDKLGGLKTENVNILANINGDDQVIYTGVNYAEGVSSQTELPNGVDVYSFPDDKWMFSVDAREEGSGGVSSNIYEAVSQHFSALGGDGKIRKLRPAFESQSGDYLGGNVGTIEPGFDRQSNTPFISSVGTEIDLSGIYRSTNARRYDYVTDSAYLNDYSGQWYGLQFDEPPSVMIPQATALYSEIEHQPIAFVRPRACSNDYLNVETGRLYAYDMYYALAARKLPQWGAALVGQRVLESKQVLPTIHPELYALAHALLEYRDKIVAIRGWKKKFDTLFAKNYDSTQPVPTHLIADQDLRDAGFPPPRDSCFLADSTYNGYWGIPSLDNWLYTFWIRRYENGHFDEATEILKLFIATEKKQSESQTLVDPHTPAAPHPATSASTKEVARKESMLQVTPAETYEYAGQNKVTNLSIDRLITSLSSHLSPVSEVREMNFIKLDSTTTYVEYSSVFPDGVLGYMNWKKSHPGKSIMQSRSGIAVVDDKQVREVYTLPTDGQPKPEFASLREYGCAGGSRNSLYLTNLDFSGRPAFFVLIDRNGNYSDSVIHSTSTQIMTGDDFKEIADIPLTSVNYGLNNDDRYNYPQYNLSGSGDKPGYLTIGKLYTMRSDIDGKLNILIWYKTYSSTKRGAMVGGLKFVSDKVVQYDQDVTGSLQFIKKTSSEGADATDKIKKYHLTWSDGFPNASRSCRAPSNGLIVDAPQYIGG